MRTPIHRNLDSPFLIAGFSPGELIAVAIAFVGGGEICELAGLPRPLALAFTGLVTLGVFQFRRALGERFAPRLARFLSLPGRLNARLLTGGSGDWAPDHPTPDHLGREWEVREVTPGGLLLTENRGGFAFDLEGLDGSLFSADQLARLHEDWRTVLKLDPGEELQIIFRKRVEFAGWIEDQLQRSFLGKNSYGRKILLDRLNDQIARMEPVESPGLLSQRIVACFWSSGPTDAEMLEDRRRLIRSQLAAFGFAVRPLDKSEIAHLIHASAQDISASEQQEPEWPSLRIEAGQVRVNGDGFRAIELNRLPEDATSLGMIQSITSLPYTMDVALRLTAKDQRPIVSRLGKKRNLLNARRGDGSPKPEIDAQIDQIDQVLRSLADRSEGIFDMRLTVGLRVPVELLRFQSKALADIIRAGARMNFCEFAECTLGTFDSYLECIPSFRGRSVRAHTVLASNAIHFLPFFRPPAGDSRAVASFETAGSSLYGIDPVDSRLANYNWLVSGTSGAGKSFFVNSLLAQSESLEPNIFIVDIGGSYNKLTRFLGGRVLSLEPGEGFRISPFFLGHREDEQEERLRRQHVLQIFLEMTRLDGQLPPLEARHLLQKTLDEVLDRREIPDRPVSLIWQRLAESQEPGARRLAMLLQPWGPGFFGRFVDNNTPPPTDDRIVAFDLKGLTEFEDLARVVQLIVCASVWASVRQTKNARFSWIVLDEVAFSLLRTQAEFVDELVSTLRKCFAGAVIVVQDLEKITSNPAGASILQNTQSKAIFQQRGDPRHYAEALSLTRTDLWAIESLRRKRGQFSEFFLIRDSERTIIRHRPSDLEYWLSTTAPEDSLEFAKYHPTPSESYQQNVLNFVSQRREAPR